MSVELSPEATCETPLCKNAEVKLGTFQREAKSNRFKIITVTKLISYLGSLISLEMDFACAKNKLLRHLLILMSLILVN